MPHETQSSKHQADQDSLYEFLSGFVSSHKLQLFDEKLEQRTRFLTVVLESVDKGHNASACLRSCECIGVQDLHIIRRSPDFKLRNDVISGAGRWLTVRGYRGENESDRGDDTIRYYEKLRKNGYRIVAVTPDTNSMSLLDFQPTGRTALIFGSELNGLSQEAVKNADACVQIPMHGFTESLNLSVAVAVCLHELRGRLQASATDLSLTVDEKRKIRQGWIKRAIGHRFDAYVRRFEPSL